MERLEERMIAGEKALQRLEEALAIVQPSDLERDAIIQRFEFTFEALWKVGKQYLFDVEGIDVGSPKAVIRSCREIGVLTTEQAVLALQMADDRNLTVHTYNEGLALAIFERLFLYRPLLRSWLSGLKDRTGETIKK